MRLDSRSTALDPSGFSYQIRLPEFQGPVDLLLSLIQDQRLEITAISLAAIADQYLEHVHALREQDPAELAAFVAIAARLLLIKSKALLPSTSDNHEDDDAESIANTLVQRLQEYHRARELSSWLEARLEREPTLFSRTVPLASRPETTYRNATPDALRAALRRIQKSPEPAAPSDEVLPTRAPSVIGKIRTILRRVAQRSLVLFNDLLENSQLRSEVVATFLALLELVRRKRVVASQRGLFEPISISYHTNARGQRKRLTS